MKTENKITIEQLKNYLGTGLKVKTSKDKIKPLQGYKSSSQDTGGFEYIYLGNQSGPNHTTLLHLIKPICYRLQDLDKFIPELGFVPIDKIYPADSDFEKDLGITPSDHLQSSLVYGIDGFCFTDIQKLFEWHFWVFCDEYFNEGIIIDKLTYGK
jgi:hypothetical protein